MNKSALSPNLYNNLSTWEKNLLEGKGIRVTVKEDSLDLDSTSKEKAPSPSKNAIFFDRPDEAEQAIGMLMYRSIPWKSRGQGQSNFIEFDSREALLNALAAIKRKFDVVENGERRVALIEFDNLGDFKRVMDYIKRTNMGITFLDADKTGDLTEDAPDLEVKPTKKDPDVAIHSGCFRAKNKDPNLKINPVENPMQRRVRIQRRW